MNIRISGEVQTINNPEAKRCWTGLKSNEITIMVQPDGGCRAG
jgi:hypothetical protein